MESSLSQLLQQIISEKNVDFFQQPTSDMLVSTYLCEFQTNHSNQMLAEIEMVNHGKALIEYLYLSVLARLINDWFEKKQEQLKSVKSEEQATEMVKEMLAASKKEVLCYKEALKIGSDPAFLQIPKRRSN